MTGAQNSWFSGTSTPLFGGCLDAMLLHLAGAMCLCHPAPAAKQGYQPLNTRHQMADYD